MEVLFNNYSVSDILIFGFVGGFLFNMVYSLGFSLMNYLDEKSFRVKDYEMIIFKYLGTCDVFTEEEKEIIATARNNYVKRMNKGKKISDLLNKFKKKK